MNVSSGPTSSCRFSSLVYGCASLLLFISAEGKTLGDDAAKKNPAARLVFEVDVAPILRARCFTCHAGRQPKAGLDLSSFRRVMLGGRSGAAVRRAAAESSLLWERIAADEMPPKGPKLTAEEKGLIRNWINQGAMGENGQDDSKGGAGGETQISDEERRFWSFSPPVRTSLPPVQAAHRLRNSIDAYILNKLEASQLTLSGDADRRTLIRRAYFDLLGLPPSPEAVRSFLADERPDAYERLIDQLLASPAYGERWARHWLDVAGYADSAGILSEDRGLPLAYHYRDYVIRAFNQDKPYDVFLQEQIAGDELVDYWRHFEQDDALAPEIIEALTATGFLRCAPDASRPDFKTIKNADALYYYPTLNDTMQIVASSIMGVTLQCARCHDHMFDPIPQEDFYRLQAVFMGAYRPGDWIPQMERRLTTLSKSQLDFAKQRNKEVDENTKRLEGELTKIREQFKQKRFDDQLGKLPESIRDEVRQALETPADKRDAAQLELAGKHAAQLQPDDKQLDLLLPAEYEQYQPLRDKLKEQIAAERRRWYYYDEIRALYDLPGVASTPLLRRGDALTPAHNVSPGALSVLNDVVPFQWRPSPEARTSGRRLAFARWLTNPKHPLTARVMANRIWRHHFGEGIVATPDDFGRAGSPPSHPELLDWLAVELVESGWSVKHLHRLIMTSSTFRQRSRRIPRQSVTAIARDPENRLLWRQRMRRLEAEAIRDSVLHIARTLRPQMYGAAVGLHVWPDGEVTVYDKADPYRRSIYLQNLRLKPVTMLNAFDQPVMQVNCVVRSQSTVSTQALTLLNSSMVSEAAEAFAGRVLAENGADPAKLAVELALGRPPAPEERKVLNEFLSSQQRRRLESLEKPNEVEARRLAVVDLCHMLLSANEFIYVD